MDNAWAEGIGSRSDVLAMGEQGIDKCSRPMAGGGVDDHAGGLIDRQEIFIFIEDLEGDRLGLEGGFRDSLKTDLDLISLFRNGPFFNRFPIDQDGAAIN